MTNSRHKNTAQEMRGYITRTKADRQSRELYGLTQREIVALSDMFIAELRNDGVEFGQALFDLIEVTYDYGFSKGIRAMQNKGKRKRKERKA